MHYCPYLNVEYKPLQIAAGLTDAQVLHIYRRRIRISRKAVNQPAAYSAIRALSNPFAKPLALRILLNDFRRNLTRKEAHAHSGYDMLHPVSSHRCQRCD